MTVPLVNIAVEGPADVGVARALLRAVGLVPTDSPYVLNGKGNLDRRIAAYCRAAAHAPWLVLRDLDQDAPCAGALVSRLAPTRPLQLCLRIAIHSAESWLLADRARIADFLHISPALVPAQPDLELNAKQVLVGLSGRSRRRDIREDMAPRSGSTARVGPNYMSRVNEFAEGVWDPRAASKASPSLARCLAALARLLG
ncbi:MAG TPA: hypothetical protein VMK42_13370 [Anaeromyxobacteraceae bacterium]|nr:hypothetical protein [Anaeromyxobacteraceae bacterium]